jgi:hypothetical protein
MKLYIFNDFEWTEGISSGIVANSEEEARDLWLLFTKMEKSIFEETYGTRFQGPRITVHEFEIVPGMVIIPVGYDHTMMDVGHFASDGVFNSEDINLGHGY